MRFDRPDDETLIITFTDEEMDHLMNQIFSPARRVDGGFQNLQYYWYDRLDVNTVVITDPIWIERSLRYTTEYGTGGFQRTLGGRARYGKSNV